MKQKARKSQFYKCRKISIVSLSSLLLIFLFQNCASDGAFETTTNNGSNITLVNQNETGEEGNVPPTISIVTPQQVTEGSDLVIETLVEDEDGTIQKVELYYDDILVEHRVSAPFTFTLSQVMGGSHSVTAKAFDNSGGITTSLSVRFAVAGGALPTIDVCLPSNGYVAPSISIPSAIQNINMRIGMQDFSPVNIGDDYDRRNYNLIGGLNNTYGAVTRNIDCDAIKRNSGLNLDCNGSGIRIRPGGNNDNPTECHSGSTDIEIEVTDSCGGRATATLHVNYSNVCKDEQHVWPDDASTQGTYGSRVAISGSHAAISAPGYGGNNKIGAVYTYTKTNGAWSKGQTLTPTSVQYSELNAVDIKGNTLAIASRATSLNGHTGRVYIYTLANGIWSLTNTINGPTPTQNPSDITKFGVDIKISDGQIFVGADNEDWSSAGLGGVNSGAVYIYNLSGTLLQRITASNAKPNHNFGRSLSVVGSTLVVGAPIKSSSESATNGGSVYVFNKSGSSWTESNVLNPEEAKGSAQQFGAAVSTDGSNTIVIGAKQANDGRGGAYIFTRSGNTWSQNYITAPDRSARDYFGRSVAVSGGTVFVSSPGARHNNDEIGGTYVYNLSGTLTFKSIPKSGSRNVEQNAGSSISVSGNILLMGSEASNSANFNNSGAAYFINLN